MTASPIYSHQPAANSHNTLLATLYQKARQRILGNKNFGDNVDDAFDTDGYDDVDTIYYTMYTTPISIGSPPLTLTATVDTSWSTLFVPSANCTSKQTFCVTHPQYDSSLSSTYRADLRPAAVHYGGLQVHGNVSQDSIHVAGIELTDQLFAEGTEWLPDVGVPNYLFDTALGLSLSPTRYGDSDDFATPSPFQKMMEHKLLEDDTFYLKLGRTEAEMGELILGGLPSGISREDMLEVPLDHSRQDGSDDFWGYYTMNGWQVSVSNMSIDSTSSNLSLPVLETAQIAVISSSFPWIGLPDRVARGFIKLSV
jgi:hypothetical protein